MSPGKWVRPKKKNMEEQAMDMGRVGHPGVGKWPKAWRQLYVTAGHCKN